MKKGIAFVLAAVMCLGFVGCGEKAGSAKSVYNSLKKVGKLSLEAEYQNVEVEHISDKAPVLEQIVFRLPEEEREVNAERACYIETYPSVEEAEKNADKLGIAWYAYSSGSTVLSIDRAIKKETAEKYAKAFQKVTDGEVKRHHEEERPNNKYLDVDIKKVDGIQPKEIYDAFKKKIENIEFNLVTYEIGIENVGFYDRSQGYDQEVFAYIIAFNEKVEYESGPTPNGGYNLVRGNILVEFWDILPEERIAEYEKVLDELLK